MGDLILLFLVHFGIPKELSKTVRYLDINRLTFGLRIRKLDPNLQKSVNSLALGDPLTKTCGASCRNYRALHVYQLDINAN